MKQETLDLVLEKLDTEVYTTMRVLKERTNLSLACVKNAIEFLTESKGVVESIYVKNMPGVGRAEVAFIKAEE